MRIGTTSEEVERLLDMRHQTVSSRRTALRDHGYTDYYRINGIIFERANTSGRNAKVEIATLRGKLAIKHGIPLLLRARDPTENYHGGDSASIAAYRSIDMQACSRRVLACMCRYTP